MHTKVCIICPIHGEFWQRACSHVQGHGCQKCKAQKLSVLKTRNKNIFVSKAREVHGDFYDYSKVDYKDSQTKVCIICPIHGEFWQTPAHHLFGHGCQLCANAKIAEFRRNSIEHYLKLFDRAHGDKYSYELITSYNGCDTPVPIVCPKHGVFYQTPYSHSRGCGCPHCNESHGEREIAKWLDNHYIKYERQYKVIPEQVLFGRNKFLTDFYLTDYNTIIEYHGEQHYIRQPNWHTEEQFAEQQDRDRRLREHCKQHKIRLIEIPYTEIDNIDKILTKKILKSKKI